MQKPKNTYHISTESHHHHKHSDVSKHISGYHILQVEDLDLYYKKTSKDHVFSRYVNTTYQHILKGVNISVHGNEIIALVGESGSGKTTIAKVLTNQITPADTLKSGHIYLSGKEMSSSASGDINNEILYIPQGISALDPTYKYKINDNLIKDLPKKMSGGMAKIALINYAFAQINSNLKLIIADEPTDGLDFRSKNDVMSIFKDNICENTGMLLITHDIDLALSYADRIAIIKEGCIVEETSTDLFKLGELTSDFAKKIHDTMPKYWNRDLMRIQNSICLFGDTGCGKTTIAKNLSGYLQGFDIPEINAFLGDINSKNCEMIFQDPYSSFPQNSKIITSFSDIDIKDCQEFQLLKIDEDWLNKYPRELSGGQLQRLSILKTLIQKPGILIADEATSMCDCVVQFEIFKSLKTWCEINKCRLIFITHDIDIRDNVADKVIYLDKYIN